MAALYVSIYVRNNINYWIRGDLCDDRLLLAVFMLETLKLSKGLAKLGNIVAETMFLVIFPGVAKLGNMFRTQNLCPGSKNVFDSRQKHFFVFEQQNLFPQHMFPARLN